MTNEKMREEFENWLVSKSKDTAKPPEKEYVYFDYVEMMWQAWQASRENTEVELPSARYSIIETFDTDGNLEDTGIYSSNEGEFYKVKEVKQKLTDQGFKVK